MFTRYQMSYLIKPDGLIVLFLILYKRWNCNLKVIFILVDLIRAAYLALPYTRRHNTIVACNAQQRVTRQNVLLYMNRERHVIQS